MRETWYVLEDGTAVDPNDCTADEKGQVLTHKSGGIVAMRAPGVPMSRGVDVDQEVARKPSPTPPPPPAAPKATADMKPAPTPRPRAKKPGYKTRKAR